jgi:hypothetical protein
MSDFRLEQYIDGIFLNLREWCEKVGEEAHIKASCCEIPEVRYSCFADVKESWIKKLIESAKRLQEEKRNMIKKIIMNGEFVNVCDGRYGSFHRCDRCVSQMKEFVSLFKNAKLSTEIPYMWGAGLKSFQWTSEIHLDEEEIQRRREQYAIIPSLD